MNPDVPYSFEHGIDHCGQSGIAPILCVGHRITERDFVERDLSGIRGVSVSQRGLSPGTKWKDLNLGYLLAQLQSIEYLRILFDDSISLDVIGPLPSLRYLEIDCPTVRGTLQGEMSELQSAHVRWADVCTTELNAPRLERLTLVRPRCENLKIISHLTALVEVDIHLSRNLCSLDGIERFETIEFIRLHDCSKLTDLSITHEIPGPKQLVIGGCKRFVDATAATHFKRLRQLSIYRGEHGPREVMLPVELTERGCVLDIRGLTAVFV
jgi:hypothetical protein